MRVRVVYSVECPDWWRREINGWYGKPGLATRAECVTWLRMYGSSMDDEVSKRAFPTDDEDVMRDDCYGGR